MFFFLYLCTFVVYLLFFFFVFALYLYFFSFCVLFVGLNLLRSHLLEEILYSWSLFFLMTAHVLCSAVPFYQPLLSLPSKDMHIIEESCDCYVPIRVFCFRDLTALCGLFLDFCPRYRGLSLYGSFKLLLDPLPFMFSVLSLFILFGYVIGSPLR